MIILARAPFLAVLSGLAAMLAVYERTAYGSEAYKSIAYGALPFITLFVALGLAACTFKDKLKGQWRVFASVAVCVFVSSLWIVFSLGRSFNQPPPPSVSATGIVTESRPWGLSYAVAVDTPQGGFLLRLPPDALTEGDVIRLEGDTKPFDSNSDSDFREDRYWMARGVTAQLTASKIEHVSSGSPIWNIHRWRYTLYMSLIMNMPRLTGAYLSAAWTGKRDAMLDKAHRGWGTSHLLAVSGLHVGFIMTLASPVFKRGVWRVPLLSAVLWLYILLTGAPASAVRAGLMIQAALAGELAGRPGSPVNSVSLAAVLLLLRSPFWFWDVGWRLSVLAALAIAVTSERWGTFGWRTLIFMNAMIWFATFPQVSWTFGGMPLAGILINLAAPLLFGAAITGASIAAGLYLLGVPGARILLMSAESTFTMLGVSADALARLIPWQMTWSPVVSYCCAALFAAFTFRAFFMPWGSVIILSPMTALAACALLAA